MSISSLQSNIDRLRRDISDLNKKLSQELKNESNIIGKINSTQSSLRGNVSASTLESKLRDLARYNDESSKIAARKADIERKLADKTKDRDRYQQDLDREQARESKKREDDQKKLEELNKRRHREQMEREKAVTAELQRQKQIAQTLSATPAMSTNSAPAVQYDCFISHASEDKKEFVSALGRSTDGARLRDLV